MRKGGIEVGVVCLNILTNGLVAVVYSTGILKVWSSHNGAVIAEYDLL